MNQNFKINIVFSVVIGYDDLVYSTATGMNVILQHGQSWTFECRYKLNSEGNGDFNPQGDPEIWLGEGEGEVPFEMVRHK